MITNRLLMLVLLTLDGSTVFMLDVFSRVVGDGLRPSTWRENVI
jgi:hypothetical protein